MCKGCDCKLLTMIYPYALASIPDTRKKEASVWKSNNGTKRALETHIAQHLASFRRCFYTLRRSKAQFQPSGRERDPLYFVVPPESRQQVTSPWRWRPRPAGPFRLRNKKPHEKAPPFCEVLGLEIQCGMTRYITGSLLLVVNFQTDS
jgi:hypothetical protein